MRFILWKTWIEWKCMSIHAYRNIALVIAIHRVMQPARPGLKTYNLCVNSICNYDKKKSTLIKDIFHASISPAGPTWRLMAADNCCQRRLSGLDNTKVRRVCSECDGACLSAAIPWKQEHLTEITEGSVSMFYHSQIIPDTSRVGQITQSRESSFPSQITSTCRFKWKSWVSNSLYATSHSLKRKPSDLMTPDNCCLRRLSGLSDSDIHVRRYQMEKVKGLVWLSFLSVSVSHQAFHAPIRDAAWKG